MPLKCVSISLHNFKHDCEASVKRDKHSSNWTATNKIKPKKILCCWKHLGLIYLVSFAHIQPVWIIYLISIKTCNYSFISTSMLSKTNSIKLECNNPKSILLMGHVCWQHFALHLNFTLFMLNGQVAVFPSYFHFSVPVKLGISKRGNHFMKPGTANSPESSYASLHHGHQCETCTASLDSLQLQPCLWTRLSLSLKSWEMMAKEEHRNMSAPLHCTTEANEASE